MLLKLSIIFTIFFISVNCQEEEVVQNGTYYGYGYTNTPGIGAHKFHKQAKTWDQARKTCIEEGAHLAILDSKEEEQLLHGILTREFGGIKNATSTDAAWLGVHNFFNTQNWVTVLGQPLESIPFVAWHKANACWGPQPNQPTYAHCATLIRPCGMMDDAYCDFRFAFFCEKPTKKRVTDNNGNPGVIDTAQSETKNE